MKKKNKTRKGTDLCDNIQHKQVQNEESKQITEKISELEEKNKVKELEEKNKVKELEEMNNVKGTDASDSWRKLEFRRVGIS